MVTMQDAIDLAKMVRRDIDSLVNNTDVTMDEYGLDDLYLTAERFLQQAGEIQ